MQEGLQAVGVDLGMQFSSGLGGWGSGLPGRLPAGDSNEVSLFPGCGNCVC